MPIGFYFMALTNQQKFIQFLKGHKALASFTELMVKTFNNYGVPLTLQEYLDINSDIPAEYVKGGFVFNKTENPLFWARIDRLWRLFLERNS